LAFEDGTKSAAMYVAKVTGVKRRAQARRPVGNQSPSWLRGTSAWTEISTIAAGS
jgi:hypothetical protein